jgi:Tfp pilus assembly protein PilF/TolB-like protein
LPASGGFQNRYNRGVLRVPRVIIILLLVLGAALSWAQGAPQTLLVLPFDNTSKVSGLEWISEAFPEVIGEGISSRGGYVVSRDDRVYAFDRMGVPATTRLSRQTLYRISEQIDVDYVVFGGFQYDGQTFTATAQLLDMKKLYLAPEIKESGPLVNMMDIQRSLTWGLLRELLDEPLPSKEAFKESFPPVRLDAFENYIRGVLAANRQERIQRFREALRLNPNYTQAMMQLGKTYYENREYESASAWFARVPQTDSLASEASFSLGLSAFYANDNEKAESAFRYLASKLPLTEVNNNLGVVLGRRGKRGELEYLQKAVTADPNDADYHFNVAVAYARTGDNGAAIRQLKEALRLRPSDAEAKSYLESLINASASGLGSSFRQTASSGAKLPLQRIKKNFDETSFRSLALEIERAAESRLANATPQKHAAFHVERGRQFLSQGFGDDAEKAFQQAVVLDPTNAEAHLGLARVYEADGKSEEAVAEANAALKMQPSAGAYLVLARQNLKDNKLSAASQQVDLALALEPSSREGQDLKRTVEEKIASTRN